MNRLGPHGPTKHGLCSPYIIHPCLLINYTNNVSVSLMIRGRYHLCESDVKPDQQQQMIRGIRPEVSVTRGVHQNRPTSSRATDIVLMCLRLSAVGPTILRMSYWWS